jgi:hypothetical protein
MTTESKPDLISISDDIDCCKRKIDNLISKLNNREARVDRTFESVRDDIDLKTESNIQTLTNLKNDLLDKVHSQKAHIMQNTRNCLDLSQINAFIDQAQHKCIEWTSQVKLKVPGCATLDIDISMEDKLLVEHMILFENLVFNNQKQVLFEDASISVRPVHIGTLRQYQMYEFEKLKETKPFIINYGSLLAMADSYRTYSVVLLNRMEFLLALVTLNTVDSHDLKFYLFELPEGEGGVLSEPHLSTTYVLEEIQERRHRSDNVEIKLEAYKDGFAIGINHNMALSSQLHIYDKLLNRRKQIDLDFRMDGLRTNSKSIFVVQQRRVGMLAEECYVFNSDLQLIRKFGQSKNVHEPFFFKSVVSLRSASIQDEFIYVRTSNTTIDKMSLATGNVLKRFTFDNFFISFTIFGNKYVLVPEIAASDGPFVYNLHDFNALNSFPVGFGGLDSPETLSFSKLSTNDLGLMIDNYMEYRAYLYLYPSSV